MSEEINVDEVIRTIQFSEIAQKGYKVMSNDEFDRIVNGILNLQQENQQLKEENTILRGHHQEMVNYAYDYMLQKDKYKLVLDEIREYINNTFTISSVKDMYKIMDGIEEILDKVKE